MCSRPSQESVDEPVGSKGTKGQVYWVKGHTHMHTHRTEVITGQRQIRGSGRYVNADVHVGGLRATSGLPTIEVVLHTVSQTLLYALFFTSFTFALKIVVNALSKKSK